MFELGLEFAKLDDGRPSDSVADIVYPPYFFDPIYGTVMYQIPLQM